MRNLWPVLFWLALAACAPSAARTSPTAIPSVPTVSHPTVDVYVTLADSDTEELIAADVVWLDNEVAFRNVHSFTLLLNGDYPPDQDGYEVRIEAKGYEKWTTRLRPHTRQSRTQFLPIHLRRTKPQS
jgi:hypothetical protein